MSCELMLIISNTINPARDIQVLDLVFVHIKQALLQQELAVPVTLQSTALQQKVQTSPADTWPRDHTMWPSLVLRDPGEKRSEFRHSSP